jgi:hypothetical protein
VNNHCHKLIDRRMDPRFCQETTILHRHGRKASDAFPYSFFDDGGGLRLIDSFGPGKMFYVSQGCYETNVDRI